MKKIMVLGVVAFGLTACGLSPGMKFKARANSPYQAKVIQQGQFTIRIVPISRKLIHLQNTNRPQPVVMSSKMQSLQSNYTYRVDASDVLSIRLWEDGISAAPDINEALTGGGIRSRQRGSDVVVDNKGYIYFPYADEVYVKGSTTSEIRRKIRKNMLRYFDDPKVTVLVKEYNSQYAMVTGQVSNPGRLSITDQPLTVFTAVHNRMGNGASGTAKPEGLWKHARLTRANGNTIMVDLARLITKGDFSQDYILRHGDRLHVPLAENQFAYMLGDGVKSEVLTLHNVDTSLGSALGKAGGVNNNANTKAVYVFRREAGRPANEITAYNLDATSPVSLILAGDFRLKPKDVVYVDAAGVVRWNRVISLIAPTFTVPAQARSTVDNLQAINN